MPCKRSLQAWSLAHRLVVEQQQQLQSNFLLRSPLFTWNDLENPRWKLFGILVNAFLDCRDFNFWQGAFRSVTDVPLLSCDNLDFFNSVLTYYQLVFQTNDLAFSLAEKSSMKLKMSKLIINNYVVFYCNKI